MPIQSASLGGDTCDNVYKDYWERGARLTNLPGWWGGEGGGSYCHHLTGDRDFADPEYV